MVIVFSLLTAILANSGFVKATTNDEFDYVIVGSGPGGGQLAANLALAGQSVFLIEAGGDSSDSILERIPSLSAVAAETAPHSWQFFVEHYKDVGQARSDPKYSYMLSNGSYYVGLNPPADATPLGLLYPRGATLGGSSQVNAMNFAWAPDNEWDYIAELTNDDTWGHKHMRRHLIDLENCTYVPQGTAGHGFDGYIQSSHTTRASEAISPENIARFTAEMFLQTEGVEIEGIEHMTELLDRDINRIDTDRYENPLMFVLPEAISPTTASRSSIAHYINDVVAAGYPLTISLHSLATKILFEKCDEKRRANSTEQCDKKPQATGVEYMVGEALYSVDSRYNASNTGEIRTVRARKEVIVSGGTFNTPQLLMLSGIGPRKELERHEIPVLVNLPAVGNNMHDNYESGVRIHAEEPWMDPADSPCTGTFNRSDPCFIQWETNATGPYSGGGGTFFFTWRSSASWDKDVDLFFLSLAGYSGEGFFPGYSNVTVAPSYWSTSIVKMQTGNGAGTVTLRSKDPRDAPEINFNYFTNRKEEDLQALVEGVELMMGVYDTIGIPYTVINPNPNKDMRQSLMDEAFGHHATSTCRMGPTNDKEYCVDSKFRVNGVKNLRVVDASVFPRVPGAMPNGPTFTISRKAFETILEGS